MKFKFLSPLLVLSLTAGSSIEIIEPKNSPDSRFEPEVDRFRAVYADNVSIGCVLLEIDAVKQRYFIWRFTMPTGIRGKGLVGLKELITETWSSAAQQREAEVEWRRKRFCTAPDQVGIDRRVRSRVWRQ